MVDLFGVVSVKKTSRRNCVLLTRTTGVTNCKGINKSLLVEVLHVLRFRKLSPQHYTRMKHILMVGDGIRVLKSFVGPCPIAEWWWLLGLHLSLELLFYSTILSRGTTQQLTPRIATDKINFHGNFKLTSFKIPFSGNKAYQILLYNVCVL